MRLPPQNIDILLPVWGERYARDFLELCLPSLLAPGNVPALSRLGSCTFVLLAPARDAEAIERSPLWRPLSDACAVRIEHIDDLISQSSSTVLTLAYALAIRQAGRRALDTCFVPLVADYVLADGSLRAVVERIVAGASGVLAGNFQVARETAVPLLQKSKTDAGILSIAPRALVELSFKALHSATLAEIVNESPISKPETNRFFWRVDNDCMMGRFFLMHMIAIRPERTDFIIAGPSDYSLIPELCPLGEIVRMTDSDDYFVVECQPQRDGSTNETSVGIEPRSFAKMLTSWATAMHRDNAGFPVVFHAGGQSPMLAETVAVSDAFVSEIDAHRAGPPMPFRNHPLWRPALDYHMATAQMEQDPSRLAMITGDVSLLRGQDRGARLRSILLGRAPYFRPWHPRWPDVQMLKSGLAATSGEVAIVSNASARVRTWLDQVIAGRGGRSGIHIRLADLRDEASVQGGRFKARFDSLVLVSDLPVEIAEILACLAPMVKPGGTMILCIGRIFSETEHELIPVIAPNEIAATVGRLASETTSYITLGPWRAAIQGTMMRLARKSARTASWGSLFGLAGAGGLAAISMFFNIAARRRSPPERSQFSSLFLSFRNTGGHSVEPHPRPK